MKSILVLGATGSLAQVVIEELIANPDLRLTLVARRPQALQHLNNERIQVVAADILQPQALLPLMQGQDLVYANLAGELVAMADNVINAMRAAKVKRLIWVSSMGIYGETGEDHGAILTPYRQSAERIEQSGLDYTILRPAWFTYGKEVDYQLTRKGEPFQGQQVSRRSVAHLIVKLICKPEYAIGESLGIARGIEFYSSIIGLNDVYCALLSRVSTI